MKIALYLALCFPLLAATAADIPTRAPEGYVFLVTTHSADKAMIVDAAGATLWDAAVQHPQEAQVLPSGNILTSYLTGLREIARDTKAVVWDYPLPEGAQNPLARCLAKNRFLVGMEGPCKVREIATDGTLLHEAQLSAKSNVQHGQFRLGGKTAANTYLLPMLTDNEVREFDQDGTLLRTLTDIPSPVSTSRLDDGRLLVGFAGGIRQYDAQGNIVWSLEGKEIGVELGYVTTVLLLDNGDMILANYLNAGPDLLEIAPDKRLLWTLDIPGVTNVPEAQLLDANWLPAKNVRNRPLPY